MDEDISRYINTRLDRLEARSDEMDKRVSSIETRLTAYEQKMNNILDSTSQIKDLLLDNGKDTKSAKRNAKGWGFLSVFISLAVKVGEFFLRDGIAL